ncbi:Lrp/AsnC family transcriptional regulator [Pseudokineococcus lusitanus]|uniref:DNA-binding Lrp family transcriptional regulator n=1 Tax=Pseudokineococcus lusitanus TaxID=763993 RepID=A0A3N1HTR1_9ACTN|nr:AsnC family transcriptional regulator [Pseudokineococcus lusitanus]ROP45901.1 DNA-binding Lrp family transcriptional regulator [Pseudokineococcus lusitanus]
MDELDEKVLRHLVRDGRATFAQVGDAVGLSASAVKRRVDRLVESGALRGFTAVVDPAALGWRTEAYVEVRCDGPVAPAELRRRLVEIPEVVEAVTVTGRADALLRLLAADVQHLERALERVRDELDVAATESVIVLSRLLDRARPGT